MPLTQHTKALEDLYRRYNRREYVHPDPLEFLFHYDDSLDREVVALVASALAYGRVKQILKSVSVVLDRIGADPVRFLRDTSPGTLHSRFVDFTHRFCRGEHLSALLLGTKRLLEEYGSLQRCFVGALRGEDTTVVPALKFFVGELSERGGGGCGHLLPDPTRSSPCKRLHLFLRWMVRRDRVDPGGWDGVPRSLLLVPLDTHMHRISLGLGATKRKTPDLTTTLEITDAFRKISPEDPAKYDFALTRLGIHPDGDLDGFLERTGRIATCDKPKHIQCVRDKDPDEYAVSF